MNDSSDQSKELLTSKGTIFFQLMNRVGAMGRYQIINLVLLSVMSYMGGGLMFMPSFIFYQDPYHCNDTSTVKQCLDFVCSKEPSERLEFIPDPLTIYSAASKFGDYRCSSENVELALVLSVVFSGGVFGIFIMSILGDLLSRRYLLMGNLLMILLGSSLCIFSANLMMAGIGMLLCMFGSKNNFSVALVFTSQTVSQDKRQIFINILQISFCTGGLANVLWYYMLGNFTFVLIYFYLIPGLLLMMAFIFFVKDTPIGLVSKATAERAYISLAFIAKINQKDEFDLTIKEMEQIQQDYKTSMNKENSSQKKKIFSIIDLFRYPSVRKLTLLFICLDFVLDLEYFSPSLMLDQFDFSIFINGCAVQSAQIFASIASLFLIPRFKRRLYGMTSLTLIMLSCLTLVFIWDQNKEEVTDIGSNVAVLAFVFLSQFVATAQYNCYMISINQLFPTQVRVIGISFVKTMGGISLMIIGPLISVCKSSGFKIMIIFSVLAAIGVVVVFFLPQSYGKMPAEVIEELKEKDQNNDKQ